MKKRWLPWLLTTVFLIAIIPVFSRFTQTYAAPAELLSDEETAMRRPVTETGMPEEIPEATPEEVPAERDRLTISILGDSNSAYYGWSEGAAADTTNSTIRYNNTYFVESDMPVESMWWYLAAEELGAEILVNNSWSGSCVFGPNEPYAGEGTDGCGSRSVNLHDDTGENAGEEPDIIVIFLGTDDCTFRWTTLGSAAEVDHDALITETEDGVQYAVPTTSAEAYPIMLDKIMRRYPNALVFCMTVLPRRDANASQYYVVETMNNIIRTEAARCGAFVVDVYRDSGITSEISCFDRYMMDLLHPNEAGMALIANLLVSAIHEAEPLLQELSAKEAEEEAEAEEEDESSAEKAVSVLLQTMERY